MDKWWKAPILQGPENDYGDYDYLIEELPKDYARWSLTKETWKCDECGEYSHLLFETAQHFYCWDGWDSMQYNTCWKCEVKSYIHRLKWKVQKAIKKHIKAFNEARELYNIKGNVYSFMYCYKFVLNLERR